ncbi:MAG: hypothetical protein COV36_02675 [Alphaproteobacteria bacterium CG11_big_fil_rev_8_21_14_0_20_44_7]|nr:MAG: hypothetical protein COV36_02675 [Alphaproteobacteria bacterium CG11_big_fil_rev_8_21_14_0_20_44_7]
MHDIEKLTGSSPQSTETDISELRKKIWAARIRGNVTQGSYKSDLNMIADPVSLALFKGRLDLLEKYLQEGANPNARVTFANKSGQNWKVKDYTSIFPPLYYAVQRNNLEAAELLLKYGANPNYILMDGRDELFAQPGREYDEQDHKLNPDDYPGSTILFDAVSHEMVVLLRRYGADPNYVNGDGETPLTWCAKSQNPMAITGFLNAIKLPDDKIIPPADLDNEANHYIMDLLVENLQQHCLQYRFSQSETLENCINTLKEAMLLLAEAVHEDTYEDPKIIAIRQGYSLALASLEERLVMRPAEQQADYPTLKIVDIDNDTAQPEPESNYDLILECENFSEFLARFKAKYEKTNAEIAIAMGSFESYVVAIEKGLIVPSEGQLAGFAREFAPEIGDISENIALLAKPSRIRIESSAKEHSNKRFNIIRALSEITTSTPVSGFTSSFLQHNNGELSNEVFLINEVADASNTLSKGRINNKLKDDRQGFEKRGQKVIALKKTSISFFEEFSRVLADVCAPDDDNLREFIATITGDIAFHRIAKKDFVIILDEYIEKVRESGAIYSEEVCCHDFFSYLAEEWGTSRDKLAVLLEVNLFNIFNGVWLKPGGKDSGGIFSNIVSGIESVNGKPLTREARAKLSSIRHGNILIGTDEEIADYALAILSSENPAIEDFAKNPVAKYILEEMPAQQQFEPEGKLDKSLVPTALLHLLMQAHGTTLTKFMKDCGILFKDERNFTVNTAAFASGQYPFTIFMEGEKKGGFVGNRESYALRTANHFCSGDEGLQKKLIAGFLTLPKFYEPPELADMYLEGEITLGRMAKILMMQQGESYKDWAKVMSPEAPFSAEAQKIVERDQFVTIPSKARTLAKHVAEKYYPEENLADERKECEETTFLALQGRLTNITTKDIEREIDIIFNRVKIKDEERLSVIASKLPAHKAIIASREDSTSEAAYEGREAAKIYDMMVKCTCGIFHAAGQEFRNGVVYTDRDGTKTTIHENYRSLLRDKNLSSLPVQAHMAVAKRGGLNKEYQKKYFWIASGKGHNYDPTLIGSLLGQDPALIPSNSRSKLIRELRENRKLSKTDIWQETEQTEMSYTLVEKKGFIRPSDRARDSKVKDMADSLVPETFPAHRDFIRQMLTTPPSKELVRTTSGDILSF